LIFSMSIPLLKMSVATIILCLNSLNSSYLLILSSYDKSLWIEIEGKLSFLNLSSSLIAF
jgi:hypothetical protein